MKRKPLLRRKVAKKDFSESDLPSNRFELFFDILKNHYRTLLGASLLFLLFLLPLLMVQFFLDLRGASLFLSFEAGEIAEADYLSQKGYIDSASLILFPIGMAIASIGLSGIARIIKRLCFLEPVFFFDDFKRGIKENGAHFAMMVFAFSALVSLALFVLSQFPGSLLGALPIGIVMLFVYPVALIFLPASSFYTMKFAPAVGLSFRVMLRSYGIVLPYLFVFLIPFGLQFVPDVVLRYLLLGVTGIFSSAALVALFLFAFSRFDKYINKTRYPEWVDKGIHRKAKD